jgi:hypothetical protein
VRAIRALLLLLVTAPPLAAQRSLHWREVRADARLTEDGSLRVVETQTIVFTGDWNGGQRRFDVRPRQRFQFEGMRRIDASGQAHDMREGDLSAVDEYDFVGSRTLRWRSRLPSDPPFNDSAITYEITYSYSNILVREGDQWVLDHDFGFATRDGVIENLVVRLLELQPTGSRRMFNGTWREKPPDG